MPGGRPTKMIPETLDKLRYAFSIGCTDREACLYADISEDLLYKYQRENPEYIKEKEKLKKNPCLKSKQVIMNSIENGNTIDAKWYLERRDPEFKPTQKQEHTHEGHINLINSILDKKKDEGCKCE